MHSKKQRDMFAEDEAPKKVGARAGSIKDKAHARLSKLSFKSDAPEEDVYGCSFDHGFPVSPSSKNGEKSSTLDHDHHVDHHHHHREEEYERTQNEEVAESLQELNEKFNSTQSSHQSNVIDANIFLDAGDRELGQNKINERRVLSVLSPKSKTMFKSKKPAEEECFDDETSSTLRKLPKFYVEREDGTVVKKKTEFAEDADADVDGNKGDGSPPRSKSSSPSPQKEKHVWETLSEVQKAILFR